MLNDVTISLDLNQLLGGDIDTRRTRVYVKTNVANNTLIDTSTGETRLGDERVTLEADGTGTFTTWGVGADGNPTSWQTLVVVEYPRAGSRDRVTRTFGPYTITDADDGKNLAELEDQQAIPPNYQTAFTSDMETIRDEAEAARDAAVDISNIDTPDGVVSTLIEGTAGAGPLTRSALSASTVTKAKEVGGGQFPRSLRAPVLVTERRWPNRREDYRIMAHADAGQTLWAVGFDNTVRKSVDGGDNWTRQGYQAFGFNFGCGFIRTNAGTLLGFRPGTTAIVMRSTNDGATWSSVTLPSSRSSHYPLGSQSWCTDPVTGYIYYGEYTTTDNQTDLYVYRSTDDGATFEIFHTFPGFASTSPDKVRHIHSAQWDHIAQRVVVMTGDSDPAGGMYRVNAAGTGLEPLLLNRDVPGIPDAARSIGIVPFSDYLCWTGDSTGNPWFMRMLRSEIGKPNPQVERVYRLNSTGWFTCRASDDGTRWVFTASQEAPSVRYDRSVHVYAVEDQGATVYEVGSLATNSSSIATLSPVGQPHENGEVFFLQTHNTAPRWGTWRMRLARGNDAIPWPDERPVVYVPRTIAAEVTVAANAQVVVGHFVVPALCRNFRILEAGVDKATGSGAGSARLGIRVKGTTTAVFQCAVQSLAYTDHMEAGGVLWEKTDWPAGTVLEVIAYNSSVTDPWNGRVLLVGGFGP